MTGQMTIQDWLQDATLPDAHGADHIDTEHFERNMNAPEPLCYDCEHGLPRGRFLECAIGLRGYKHIGDYVVCEKWRRKEA